jgi:hypothetical protein
MGQGGFSLARAGWTIALLAGLGAVACGSKGASTGSGGRDAAADGPSGAGGAGGGSGSDGAAEPVPLTVPADWSRPADCMAVGNLCSEGCSASTECQLFGDVCIPLAGPSGFPGYSNDTPYCLAYTCLTYAQASCFCTGSAATVFPACKYGPPAVAGLCAPEGAACVNDACCAGLACIKDTPTGTCLRRCSKAADCDTGCCTDLKDTGDLECAPASACQTPCTKKAGACTDDSACCNGTCVTGTTNPDFLGCRQGCAQNGDCNTGCCQLFNNATTGFCTTPGYCGCGAGCAANSTCLTFDGQNFACYQNCMHDADCPSGCCSQPIAGKTYGSCVSCL